MAERTEHARTVLIVDDSRVTIHMLEDAFGVLGYRAVVFTSPSEAIAWTRTNVPELALVDVHMPGIDGISFCESLRQRGEKVPTFMMTAHPSETIDRRAAEVGVLDVLPKPISIDTLQDLLDQARKMRPQPPPAPVKTEPEAEPAAAAPRAVAPPEPAPAAPEAVPLPTPAMAPDPATRAAGQKPEEYLMSAEEAVQAARRWVEQCDGMLRAVISGDWSEGEVRDMQTSCVTAEAELLQKLAELTSR